MHSFRFPFIYALYVGGLAAGATIHAAAAPVGLTRSPRVRRLVSFRPDTLIVGPVPVPLATGGLVAEPIGIMPTMPPKAPPGFGGGVATAAPAAPRLIVGASELGRSGRRPRVDAEVEAEVDEVGAPPIVEDAALDVKPGGVCRDGNAESDCSDEVVETPGGWMSPG